MSASIQFLRDDRGAAAYQARKPAVTIAYLDRFFSQLRWTTLREAEDQVRRMLDDHTLPVEAIASGIGESGWPIRQALVRGGHAVCPVLAVWDSWRVAFGVCLVNPAAVLR